MLLIDRLCSAVFSRPVAPDAGVEQQRWQNRNQPAKASQAAVPSTSSVTLRMGCSNSKDRTASGERSRAGKRLPDMGLDGEFEYIKLLGKGGTGETHLYRERRSGELVAIKLVPRPLPRVIHESIVREITVGHADSPATTCCT